MKAATHLAFAGLVGVVAAGFGAPIGVAEGAALAMGSVLPDIDTSTSGLGKWLRPFSGYVERRFGHRTLTHSFLGLSLFALLSAWLIPLNASAWLCLVLGAASHILLDAHNVTGVPLLYPLRLEFVTVYDRGMRVAYGSPHEFSFLALFAVLAIIFTPIAIDGFSPWFHRILGAPYGAVEDYVSWRNDFEVWAVVKGINHLTNQDVNARYRVIDAFDPDELLIEDAANKAYSVALQGADIQVKRIQVYRGEPILGNTYRLELSGRLVTDLIQALPRGALRVHVNAALALNGVPESTAVVGEFQRLKASGHMLIARAASPEDFAPYANYLIESGSAVVRADYPVGSEVLADLELGASPAKVKSHLLAIPNLPSLSGLLVEVGDQLSEGQLIARYVDDAKLKLSDADLEEAKLKLQETDKTLGLQEEAHKLKLSSLTLAEEIALEAVERLKYLVARNAEPRNRLSEAEAHLKQAQQAILLEASDWTSQKTRLEQDLRQQKLAISSLEEKQNQSLEDQWVRASVSGLVTDIRVAGITTKGIDVELMILESLTEY